MVKVYSDELEICREYKIKAEKFEKDITKLRDIILNIQNDNRILSEKNLSFEKNITRSQSFNSSLQNSNKLEVYNFINVILFIKLK